MPNGNGKLVICVDLDGTLCTNTNGDYMTAEPIFENIAKVNKLFEEGHTIIIDSARGSSTGISWLDFTAYQLNSWECKYDMLYVGEKLEYDVIVDDKAVKPIQENWV